MKKRTVIFLLFLILAIVWWWRTITASHSPGISLHNNVVISGKITEVQISTNHGFGIIFLRLNKNELVSVPGFSKAGSKMPYRILNDQAEIYASLPYDLQQGDSVVVDSNKEKIFYILKQGKERVEGSIYTISDPTDLHFIAKHSKLK